MSAWTSRSLTGNNGTLPPISTNKHRDRLSKSNSKTKVNVALTRLRGAAVMWRIWPAVLLHTVFAAAIVIISEYTTVKLNIPNIMLTLLGVVIGFVISLRVSSGYDRYWWGRCAWSDLVKNSRTMSRLIWIHVPPRLGKMPDMAGSKTPQTSHGPLLGEIGQVMREKRMMLNLIEAFAVSLKHYIRGELGIYYEDMYNIVRPFHEHQSYIGHGHGHRQLQHSGECSTCGHLDKGKTSITIPTADSTHTCFSIPATTEQTPLTTDDVAILSYGSAVINESSSAANHDLRHASSNTSFAHSTTSNTSIREPLLPAQLTTPNSRPSPDVMPFGSFFMNLGHMLHPYTWYITLRTRLRKDNAKIKDEYLDEGVYCDAFGRHPSRRRAARQIHRVGSKHQLRLGGDGDNLPLEIIRCMSEWVCVLETREIVGGNAIGGIYGCLAAYEDILGTLERIQTTPLPYVYSQHIRHTVWLYLFFLPFQLAEEFHWYSVPGVAVAAFFYLGFLAAGDEIEQPFGYDKDDLDLDLFCRDIIKSDLQMLMATPCPNAPTGFQLVDSDIIETRTVVELCVERGREEREVREL